MINGIGRIIEGDDRHLPPLRRPVIGDKAYDSFRATSAQSRDDECDPHCSWRPCSSALGGVLHGSARPFGRQLIKAGNDKIRSEEHTSELQSLMRIPYHVFCLKQK